MDFILREPLLGPQQSVLGCELSWCRDADQNALSCEHGAHLLRLLADHFDHSHDGPKHKDFLLFVDVDAEILLNSDLDPQLKQTIVARVSSSSFADPAGLHASVAQLRASGFRVAVGADDYKDLPVENQYLINHVEFDAADPDYMARVKTLIRAAPGAPQVVVRSVKTWNAYDACCAAGISAFVGNLYLTTKPGTTSKKLSSAQEMIAQLMDKVRKNSDVRELEELLKHDAALSFKLLSYINSAAFGAGRQIDSLKQAVLMIGLSPLYRWLSVLLATSNASGHSPVLMHMGMVRGRLAELLGKKHLPQKDVDCLFVVGMFSLLDELLGIPMEKALATILLPDTVKEALLTRGGLYGPYLALVEACEVGGPDPIGLAKALGLTEAEVTGAHLSAIAWAQKLEL